MSNTQLEEKQEEDFNKKLAKQIGLEYEELMELDYEIHQEESEDGLVYNQYIAFNKDVAPEVLKKIKGLDQNYWLYI